jgi:hypothetical protein
MTYVTAAVALLAGLLGAPAAQKRPITYYYICVNDPTDLDDSGKPRTRVHLQYDTSLDSPVAIEAFGTAEQVAQKAAKEVKKDHPDWKVWISSRHPGPDLGTLSERHEVGKGGPKTISPGTFKDKATGEVKQDKGGKSYGSFQFASKRGLGGSTVQALVDKNFADDFKGKDSKPLKPGTKEFDDKWVEVVDRDVDEFKTKEHDFIKETHYDPVVKAVLETLGLDVEARSRALQNVVWSTAVQHGPPEDPKGHAVDLLKAALGAWDKESLTKIDSDGPLAVAKVPDDAIIKAIYDERGRVKEDGDSVYFPGLDLSPRFTQERKEALDALASERELTVVKVLDTPQ